jgi:hypothetical protein
VGYRTSTSKENRSADWWPNPPTYREFKETLSYANKKEKGELVMDFSSFSNADLEALGG